MMRILQLTIFGLFIFLIPCSGQQVSSRLDSIQFLIGDQTRLILEGNFPKAIDEISFSKTTIDTTTAIEFVNQSSIYKELTGTTTKYSREFLIAFFDTGAYYIPQIPIITSSAGKSDTYYTAPIPIHVRPMAVDSLEMMAIKPIILEEWKLIDFWPFAAIIIGLALLAFIIYRSHQKRNQAKNQLVEIPKTPYELAMIALEKLEDMDYVNQHKIKEHFSQLSIILRNYIEQQFKFPALESTTREIGYGLDAAKFETDLKTEVLDYLQKIDLIKFAKVEPNEDDIVSSLVTTKKQIDRMSTFFSATMTTPSPNNNAGL